MTFIVLQNLAGVNVVVLDMSFSIRLAWLKMFNYTSFYGSFIIIETHLKHQYCKQPLWKLFSVKIAPKTHNLLYPDTNKQNKMEWKIHT